MRLRRILAIGLVLALAGCRAAAWQDYHHTDPVEYYFWRPESVSPRGPRLLVIALLGESGSPLDCIELFQPLAEDRGYALLCPRLGGAQGLEDPLVAEQDLAAVLRELYADSTFQDRFFLAGFADGGSFALAYAFKYPQAVVGVSAMSVGEYPEAFGVVGAPPVQLVIGSGERGGLRAAQAIEQAWRAFGLLVRVVEVGGDGRRPTLDFARLASQLAEEVTR